MSNLCTEICLPQDRNNVAVCNLISVNLAAHVANKEVNWAKLEESERQLVAYAGQQRIINLPGATTAEGTRLPDRSIDADDLVIGATRAARLALGLATDRAFAPVPAADLLNGPNGALEQLGDVERGVLQRALLRADGNVSAAAKTLGISRATLHRKLKRFERRAH